MIIQGNYPNFTALKAALGSADIALSFYDNDKSMQCWVTNSESQICITTPKDTDPASPIVVQSSIREFTMEKKKGQKFLALWVFNGDSADDRETLATF